MQHFSLKESPFSRALQFDYENIFEFLIPLYKELLTQTHVSLELPAPPSALFLRSKGSCSYLNGYDFSTFDNFTAEITLEAQTADMLVTCAELGSLSQDYSRGLVLLCAQTRSFYRARVVSFKDSSEYEIYEDPLRIHTDNGVCYLTGLDFLVHPFLY